MKLQVKDPQTVLFGVFLVLLGSGGFFFARGLKMGTALNMGPGYLPSVLSVLILIFGAGFILAGLRRDGPPLERVAFRPLLVVLAVVIFFGTTIKLLGLFITILLSTLITALATRSPTWGQTIIFGVLLAAGCVLIFSVALNLALPIWPS